MPCVFSIRVSKTSARKKSNRGTAPDRDALHRIPIWFAAENMKLRKSAAHDSER